MATRRDKLYQNWPASLKFDKTQEPAPQKAQQRRKNAMTSNKKPPVPYVARLARESVKLGLRVAGVVGGVAAGALWEAAKHVPVALVQEDAVSRDAEPIGSYWEAQNAFDAGRIQAVEMAYYRQVYDADEA